MIRRPPRSPPFPYPTPSRSDVISEASAQFRQAEEARQAKEAEEQARRDAEEQARKEQEEHARQEAEEQDRQAAEAAKEQRDRKSTRLNSSHANISYAVFCLK